MKIGLLSDTHGYLDPKIFDYFGSCDELWHAGDIGHINILDELMNFKPTKAVYGNIDNHELRRALSENRVFECDGMKIFMTHIAGYPGKYSKRVQKLLVEHRPDILVCGHSHILKIMYDRFYDCLTLNPGACGKQGFHKLRTLVRFDIVDAKVRNMEVVELGLRGQ